LRSQLRRGRPYAERALRFVGTASLRLASPGELFVITACLLRRHRAELRERRTLHATPVHCARSEAGGGMKPAPWVAALGPMPTQEAQSCMIGSRQPRSQAALAGSNALGQSAGDDAFGAAALVPRSSRGSSACSFGVRCRWRGATSLDFLRALRAPRGEVDGGYHELRTRADARRDAELRGLGLSRVARSGSARHARSSGGGLRGSRGAVMVRSLGGLSEAREFEGYFGDAEKGMTDNRRVPRQHYFHAIHTAQPGDASGDM